MYRFFIVVDGIVGILRNPVLATPNALTIQIRSKRISWSKHHLIVSTDQLNLLQATVFPIVGAGFRKFALPNQESDNIGVFSQLKNALIPMASNGHPREPYGRFFNS